MPDNDTIEVIEMPICPICQMPMFMASDDGEPECMNAGQDDHVEAGDAEG